MIRIFLLCISLSSVWVSAQTEEELIQEIKDFQAEQNEHYLDKEKSPLKKKERRKFKGHNFYDIDLSYRAIAKVELIENPDTIIMPTSAGTDKTFIRYAKLLFKIKGSDCQLVAYRRVRDRKLSDYIFIPFKDETSGTETYGGGRYLDLDIPTKDEVVLNFNMAYNPYCAYTTGWFCPLPPDENTMKIAVKAGLKAPSDH